MPNCRAMALQLGITHKDMKISASLPRRGSTPYKILKHLTVGSGVLIISMISPLSGTKIVQDLIRSYLRKKSFRKQRLLKDLKNLQSRNLIDCEELDDGKLKITLTKNGKEKTLIYKLESIKLNKSGRWDGTWRLLMFDIPHSKKRARDAFRKKLRDLDFYQLQKSVFITPYPCDDEIDFIASVFDVHKNMVLIHVKKFAGEEKLKNYFQV